MNAQFNFPFAKDFPRIVQCPGVFTPENLLREFVGSKKADNFMRDHPQQYLENSEATAMLMDFHSGVQGTVHMLEGVADIYYPENVPQSITEEDSIAMMPDCDYVLLTPAHQTTEWHTN